MVKENSTDYITKYKDCKICGVDASCMYVSQITGLCNACTIDEEYNTHEKMISGGD